jgi:hypothetical protein
MYVCDSICRVHKAIFRRQRRRVHPSRIAEMRVCGELAASSCPSLPCFKDILFTRRTRTSCFHTIRGRHLDRGKARFEKHPAPQRPKALTITKNSKHVRSRLIFGAEKKDQSYTAMWAAVPKHPSLTSRPGLTGTEHNRVEGSAPQR